MTERMRIGDLAKRARVTTRTIRYYEELGLLGQRPDDLKRAEGDFRYYTETDLERLWRIDVLKKLGLSLEQIKGIIDLFLTKRHSLPASRKSSLFFKRIYRRRKKRFRPCRSFTLNSRQTLQN